MPNCPACDSRRTIVVLGADPRGLCTACGSRWKGDASGTSVVRPSGPTPSFARATQLRVILEGPRRYRLVGELDLGTVGVLTETVAPALTTPSDQLALDLREMTFVDGVGVRTFTILNEATEGKLQLLFPTRQARRAIDLSDPQQVLNVLG